MASPETVALDVQRLRSEFPVLSRRVGSGLPLIYLDSAATSQKPKSVIQAMTAFYERQNANIHRGIHTLAEEATASYESARARVAEFVGVSDPRSLVFTRNTTESINLVANTWGRTSLKPGDMILLTEMEHHSNLVPWQMLAAEKDLTLEFVRVTDDGLLDLESFSELLSRGPSLVGFSHMSNMLGTINPVREMAARAHAVGALVLIDAAQSVPHLPVNVEELDVDFLAFSGHKMCGPTGIGVLYARLDLLQEMPPFLGGGDMIKRVHLRDFVANDVPHKFEAGTPAIAEAIGLGAAVDFLSGVGMGAIHRTEQVLVGYALERLAEVPGVSVLGPQAEQRGGVVSFTFDAAHPHDIAQVLDRQGIAVRAGHHCAMPLHERFGVQATTRASFYLYNTTEEIDSLIDGLYKVKELFG